MNISYSSLSDMKRCLRCFYLDRKMKIVRPQGIKSSMPENVDKILKESFEAYRGSLPPVLMAQERLKGYELYAGEDLKKMRHWSSNPMNIDLGNGHRVIGAFDDLLHHRHNEKFAYLDYKTTGKEPDDEFGPRYYQSQCDIYTEFMIRAKKKVADFGVLLFFWPEKGEAGGVIFNSKVVFLKPNPAAACKAFEDAIALLESPEIPAAGPTCEWCAWVGKHSGVK